MQRRKFIAAMGSLAAGGAAATGTGAFTTARVNRQIRVNVAGDANAYVGLDGSISEYAQTNNKELALTFNGAGGQNGNGLNKEADTAFRNVFKLVNNGTNEVTFELTTGIDEGNQDYPSNSPMALLWSDNEFNDTNNTSPIDENIYYFPDSSKPQDPTDDSEYGPDSQELTLSSGNSAYIHVDFFLDSDNTFVSSEINHNVSAIPDEFGFYATAGTY